jgi:hypothetical protein
VAPSHPQQIPFSSLHQVERLIFEQSAPLPAINAPQIEPKMDPPFLAKSRSRQKFALQAANLEFLCRDELFVLFCSFPVFTCSTHACSRAKFTTVLSKISNIYITINQLTYFSWKFILLSLGQARRGALN